MPVYNVIESGFINSRLYQPGEQVTTDKSFRKCPSWLEPAEELTPQQKAAKTKRENKERKEKEDNKKSDTDDINFAAATPDNSQGSQVEVLK